MRKFRVARYFVGVTLLIALLVGLVGGPVAMASQSSAEVPISMPLSAEEENETSNKLEMFSKYPIVEGRSGDEFTFDVSLRWDGLESEVFELDLIEDLPDWDAVILGGYPQKKIFALGLVTSKIGETITVKIAPLPGVMPEPGEYTITMVATSGEIRQTVDLTAKVTEKYLFAFYTTSGRLNTEIKAGKDNHFALRIQNTGSTPVTNIDFLSTKPEGWTIEFEPGDVDQVDPGYAAEIDCIISPPREVVPGDYMLNLKSVGKEVGTREINLRVTVLAPAVWGWVGVVIVLVVIAGLVYMFRQLGRR